MLSRLAGTLAGALFVLCSAATSAEAEIVYLTTGRTLSVKAHRLDGNSVVLTLRSGGEITCDRSLIARILPDEVPHPEPEPPKTVKRPSATDRDRLALTPYAEIIEAVSAAHGVDPLLVRALIKVESGFRPQARSRRGAMGLMQLMPATARQYGAQNPFDPRMNISAGVRHLKSLLDQFDLRLALAAYNAGEAAVRRFKGVPPYRETRNYVSRILSLVNSAQ